MGAEYRLDVYTAAGAKLAEITDFWSLRYRRQVNAPGVLSFTLAGDHRVVSQIEHNSQIILYRRNPNLGLPWTADFWGLFRGQKRSFSDHDVFEASCPGILTMLGWRVVAWKAGTSNRSSFSSAKAETIMKTLVSYNAGTNATTANGRVRTGTISGVSVQADGAGGNTISVDCAWDNLLEILQKVAAIGGGDFDLIKTGAAAWEFRWYTGQRGTDRTASLLFALERGNMAEPEYEYNRVDERTVAVVGGQGEGSDRVVVVRSGPDYSASNDIEVFVDARNNTTTAGLNASGDARLEALRARQQFGYRVIQTPGCAYGVHYELGDLVKAQYGTVNVTQKIVGVTVSLDDNGAEKIDVEMQTV
jgi:hypothetical protein